MSDAGATEAFAILGQVGDPGFARWITRHAARLGVACGGFVQSAERFDLWLTGPDDLLDAMEMGCLLGPQEVWVDRIDRSVLTSTPIPDRHLSDRQFGAGR